MAEGGVGMPGNNDEQKRQTEAEFMSEVQDQIRRLPAEQHLEQVLALMSSKAFQHLEQVLALMSSKAFQHLGMTEETAEFKDIDQSRLAIDAFKAILGVLHPKLSKDKGDMYRSTLSQLQLAYATHTGSGDAQGEEEEGGSG